MSSGLRVELTNLQISQSLSLFGISPDLEQIDKIREYTVLLLKWNRSISLTTITDPADIIGRHFGESMYVRNFLPVENCRLVDIGTGAGFPGLAIKIACPSVDLQLIESNKKKCAFLAEVVRVLGLADVSIRSERFESIRPESVDADLITSRAVGDFKKLLRWSSVALSEGGRLALWVGSEDSVHIVSNPSWSWLRQERLPDSQRRFILIGSPVRHP